jgi:outer membrane lipoprotein
MQQGPGAIRRRRGGTLPLVLVFLGAVLVSGCASTPPAGLDAGGIEDVGQRTAQRAPQGRAGVRVRWGGEILGVDNRPDSTDVEIYGRPLRENAEPAPSGGDGVRFIARVPGFLDPAEYGAGKRMTVKGRLAEPVTRPVGEYPYVYPVVEVEAHHLWPVFRDPAPAYWRDPFYDPWWPWWPWRPWGAYPYGHPYWW